MIPADAAPASPARNANRCGGSATDNETDVGGGVHVPGRSVHDVECRGDDTGAEASAVVVMDEAGHARGVNVNEAVYSTHRITHSALFAAAISVLARDPPTQHCPSDLLATITTLISEEPL